jgi:hypothetical protein
METGTNGDRHEWRPARMETGTKGVRTVIGRWRLLAWNLWKASRMTRLMPSLTRNRVAHCRWAGMAVCPENLRRAAVHPAHMHILQQGIGLASRPGEITCLERSIELPGDIRAIGVGMFGCTRSPRFSEEKYHDRDCD